MGVKGLFGYLNRCGCARIQSEFEYGAYLVDFHAFLFWFLETVDLRNDYPTCRLGTLQGYLLSNTEEICDALLIFLDFLRDNGIFLEFVSDGKIATSTLEGFSKKLPTLIKRRDVSKCVHTR